MNIRLGQFDLKVKSAHSRHPDFEHKAAQNIGKLTLQNFEGRTEFQRFQSNRLKEVGKGSSYPIVAIDDEDRRILASRIRGFGEAIRRCRRFGYAQCLKSSPGARAGQFSRQDALQGAGTIARNEYAR
jgi:hypothetical protein